jgi:hypothetical protein
VNLKRFDDTREVLEAAFLVEFDDYPQLLAAKTELLDLSGAVKIKFLDNKGLGGYI